jgi:N-acetylmuramoyl-L-alanine amidase
VHIEASGAFSYSVQADGRRVSVVIPAVAPNLPTGAIPVRDGLIRYVRVLNDGLGGTAVDIILDCPSVPETVWTRDRYPARLTVRLPREYLGRAFGGRTVVLDPGHGGGDEGYRGPVNLLEKNVVLRTARQLEEMLCRAGARVLLTRRGDENPPGPARLALAAEAGADLFISLHTHWSADPGVNGCAVHHNTPGAAPAARVARAVRARTRLRLRPSRGEPWLEAIAPVPGLLIEIVTISDWVEEGLLRSSHFHRQMAQGIFNGLRDYLMTLSGAKSGDRAVEGRNV